MNRLSALTLALIAVCAPVTIWLVATMKPSSHVSFAFWVVWFNALNLVVAITLVLARSAATAPSAIRLALAAVPASGLMFIAETVLLHPDPQAPIALLLTPIVQAASGGIVFLLAVLLRKHR